MTFIHPIDEGAAADLERLEQMCLPPWSTYRSKTLAIRPERPEYCIQTGFPSSCNAIWAGVINDLHVGLLGAPTNDSNNTASTIRHLHDSLSKGRFHRFDGIGLVLSAVAAILYEFRLHQRPVPTWAQTKDGVEARLDDMERKLRGRVEPQDTSTMRNHMGAAVDHVLEHMLVEDYSQASRGDMHENTLPASALKLSRSERINLTANWENFWIPVDNYATALVELALCCTRARPSLELFDEIAHYLGVFKGRLDPADFGIMMFYYAAAIRGHPSTASDVRQLGYEGVIGGMIGDIPQLGSDRLLRKLSVDVNEVIPAVIKNPDTRRRMVAIAHDIARQHCLMITAPLVCKAVPPKMEITYENGMPVLEKRWRLRGWVHQTRRLPRNTR